MRGEIPTKFANEAERDAAIERTLCSLPAGAGSLSLANSTEKGRDITIPSLGITIPGRKTAEPNL